MLAFAFLTGHASALPFQVTIQPINVCDDSGLNCGNPTEETFFAETRKIWAQADVDVTFLEFNQFNSSAFLNIDGTTQSLIDLRQAAGNGRNADSKVLNIWFLDNIAGGSLAGLAFINSNGIAIADEVFALNRIDTIAHEIGHNLGLTHESANGDDFNLMQEGGDRNIPTSILDIAPDGLGFDQISLNQVNQVRTSVFLTTQADALPEPSGMAILIIGLAATLTLSPRGRVRTVIVRR
jgi:hypothetical protein